MSDQGQSIRAITQKVLQAYRLSTEATRQLSQIIYAARVAAIIAAYRDCAHVAQVGLAADWTPPEALAKRMAREALQVAEGVAETYEQALTVQVQHFLETWQEQRAQDESERKGMLAALAAFLAHWFSVFLPRKTRQIAENETLIGSDVGTHLFCDDLEQGAIEAENDDNLELAVVPGESSDDECANYAGNTYDVSDRDLLPHFPMHLGCIHRITMQAKGA